MTYLQTSVSAHSKSHIIAAVQIMNDRQTLFTFIKVPQINYSCFHIPGLEIFSCDASGLLSTSDCSQYNWCINRSGVYNLFRETPSKDTYTSIGGHKNMVEHMKRHLTQLSVMSKLSIMIDMMKHCLFKCSTQSEDYLKGINHPRENMPVSSHLGLLETATLSCW